MFKMFKTHKTVKREKKRKRDISSKCTKDETFFRNHKTGQK